MLTFSFTRPTISTSVRTRSYLNDENMVVIQGDKDLADMFLGEFMRLFNHFYFREVAKAAAKSGKEIDKSIFLVPDDSWTGEYFDDSKVKTLERKLFR